MDPKPFEEELFDDANANVMMPPLPPTPPPTESTTIPQKLEQNTTPHIEAEDITAEDIIYDDENEDPQNYESICDDRYGEE